MWVRVAGLWILLGGGGLGAEFSQPALVLVDLVLPVLDLAFA